MLNKENYVPWSSHLLRYAKSRPNGKLIHNSILNDDELSEKELKQIKADDQAIQTILLGLSEDIYAAVDTPHQDQSSFNQNYLQQPIPNPEDITDLTTAMNMVLALMAKAFKLNYSTPTNNNQRNSSNPRNRQIVQPGSRNQFRKYAGQNAGNLTGYNDVQNIRNQIGNGNLVAARAEGNATGPRRMDAAYLQTNLLIAQKEEARIQLQAEEYDLMAAAADLDEIKEVNANCILMANLQQASTSGTQTDSAPVYDSDGSTEVHENCDDNEIFNMFTQEEQYTELLEHILESHQVPQNDNDVISKDTSVEQVSINLGYLDDSALVYDTDGSAEVHENCDDNEIFNMFTQEEQYSELLEPIPESHQVPRNDNDVIYEDTSVEQGGETVEQHPINFEETRALYESLYHNLAIEVTD
nr:hypothetical protein [Tanacetum cinerariifolium]